MKLTKLSSPIQHHTNKIRRFYKSIDPIHYLINQRDANVTKKIHMNSLYSLPNSNHSMDTADEIELIGIPYGDDWENPKDRDIFVRAIERNHPDLVFLQMSPSNFMSRQRFLAHKSALKGVEDYEIKGVEDLNPQTPITWEEAVVNLVSLDMLNGNTINDETDLTTGLATYAYPTHYNNEKGGPLLLRKFAETINTHIVGRDFSDFNIINQALYKALMGKQKVILGEMTDILYRRILANSMSLTELKDVFRFLMKKIGEMENPISFKEAAENFFPHIFLLPKDLYMTAMLKEAFQAATCIAAFVGIQHFVPIQQYWEPAPDGINFSEATRIPARRVGERDEDLVEKHALLDSLLEKRVWGENYIVNPFPYIEEDMSSLNDRDFDALTECFMFHYKKYEQFKVMDKKLQIPTFQERRAALMMNEKGMEDKQLVLELETLEMNEQVDKESDKPKLILDHYY